MRLKKNLRRKSVRSTNLELSFPARVFRLTGFEPGIPRDRPLEAAAAEGGQAGLSRQVR